MRKKAGGLISVEDPSPWWILAGISLIGVLFAPWRVRNSSSRHKNYGSFFFLIFIVSLIGSISIYAGSLAGYFIAILIDIIMLQSFCYYFIGSDRIFQGLSLYIAIGLTINLILFMVIP